MGVSVIYFQRNQNLVYTANLKQKPITHWGTYIRSFYIQQNFRFTVFTLFRKVYMGKTKRLPSMKTGSSAVRCYVHFIFEYKVKTYRIYEQKERFTLQRLIFYSINSVKRARLIHSENVNLLGTKDLSSCFIY